MKKVIVTAAAWVGVGSVAFCQTAPDTSHYGEGGDARAIPLSISDQSSISALGDINGDGYSDFVAGTSLILGRSSTDLINSSSPGMVAIPSEWNALKIKGVGDTTGDGISDLYFATYIGQVYAAYIISGAANFQMPSVDTRETDEHVQGIPYNSDNRYYYSTGFGDADGDGKNDLEAEWLDTNGFRCLILRGKAYGNYALPTHASEGYFIGFDFPSCGTSNVSGATVLSRGGDIAGLGVDSVILGAEVRSQYYEHGTPHISTAFSAVEILSYLSTNGPTHDSYGCNERAASLSIVPVGDAGGDGRADYTVEMYTLGRFFDESNWRYISREYPDGFPPVYVPVAEMTRAAGDVNGDGLSDPLTITATTIGGSNPHSVYSTGIFLDRPFGFRDIPYYLSGGTLTPIGDFNGDGYLDFYSDSGRILLGSRAGFRTTGAGIYKSYAKDGAAPLRAVGEVPGGLIYPPDARAWLGFADGDGPSLQAVTLHHTLDGVSNIPPNTKAANVHWSITSGRANYTQANLSLKYVDREIAGLNEDCLYLLESSEGPAGPWFLVESATFEKYRNTVHFQTANLGGYLIAEYLPPNVTAHTFNRDTESWTFAAPLRPDLAAGAWRDGYGALEIGIGPGENSFAFYEGPLAPVVNQPRPALYRLRYRAFTDQPNRFDNPLIRFRASLANYEQTQELVAPPVDNIDHRDEFSPSLEGTDYEQFFLAPPNTSSMRMDFDAIGTDAAYHGYARVSLDAARLEPFTADGPTTTVLNFDFRNANANGFTLAAPHPTMTPAGFDATVTADGLSLRANASDSTPRLAFQFFGKTEGGLRFEGDHLYRADFTIGSHATVANAHALPGFRLRVNSESFQFATLLHVEPRNAIQPLPTEGAPQTYSLYFKAPAAIDGEAAIFSFDYLTTPEAQADSTAAIILQKLAVAEY
ncbi:hypothetical protein BH09SUM1_BH09SUM1_11520 [soil metagenome]